MAVTYGFFNSVGGDRTYNALHISRLFDGLINDGVYLSIGNALVVRPNSSPNLNVIVGTGRAWFSHTWTLNDSDLTLTVATPDQTNPRIDTVVLEVDANDGVRANSIKIVAGTPNAVPVRPTLTRTSLLNQYPLADIYVAARTTTIIAANITNRVGTSDCPFVSGVLSTFNVSALVAQWNSYFMNTWLPAREAELDAEVDAWLIEQEANIESWITEHALRETLTANRTYYVRTDGNNANTGLVNSAGGAWLTLQHAIDFVATRLDLRQYNVTIVLSSNAVYSAGAVYLRRFLGAAHTSFVHIRGIAATIDGAIVANDCGGGWVLSELGIRNGVNGITGLIDVRGDSRVYIDTLMIYALGGNHAYLHAHAGGEIEVYDSNALVTTGCAWHYFAESHGKIFCYGDIRFADPCEYSIFAAANTGGIIEIPSGRTITFLDSEHVTGERYVVANLAIINSQSGIETVFPGTIAGSEVNGGIYI